MNLIEVEDLHVRYGAYEAVKGVSFTLGEGEILGIVGESGSGKSTIAKTLMGLEKPSSGMVRKGKAAIAAGKAIGSAGKASETFSRADGTFPANGFSRDEVALPSLQMIFQDAIGSLTPRMTVRQTLDEVLKHHARRTATVGQQLTAASLLEQIGLSTAVLDQYPREMSGGQCQRVSIARALACRPQVLVADEPVSALDVSVQARILNLLRDLRRDLGLSILLIAHDLAVVKNVCDRICVMERGRFVDAGPAADVFAHPQSDYTRHLLAAVPRIPRYA